MAVASHPFALEQYGRLGASGLALIASLHREAGEYGKLRPGSGRTLPLNTRALRADIEAALLGNTAQQQLQALGVVAVQAVGWPSLGRAWRAQPEDLPP